MTGPSIKLIPSGATKFLNLKDGEVFSDDHDKRLYLKLALMPGMSIPDTWAVCLETGIVCIHDPESRVYPAGHLETEGI